MICFSKLVTVLSNCSQKLKVPTETLPSNGNAMVAGIRGMFSPAIKLLSWPCQKLGNEVVAQVQKKIQEESIFLSSIYFLVAYFSFF